MAFLKMKTIVKKTKTLALAAIMANILIANAGTIGGLRGQRYCEIIFAQSESIHPKLEVFNTIGLNQCPEDLWSKLDPKQLKQTNDSFYVHLNGPRYWVIDGMENSNFIDPKIKNFGGITMRLAGILELHWTDFLHLQKPYQQHQVKRQTTWVYKAERPIFELMDPDKNRYIMQSYSVQKKSQTAADLKNLDKQLQLPKGWTFHSCVLQNDNFLTPLNQIAVVVQDDLLNTYQQETSDFIAKINCK